MATATQTSTGRIEENQGVVVEAVFPDELPEINSALTIDRGEDGVLVCEVQQHLGDDRVRAVAMDTTDGLARGTAVVDTGGPISVPVGEVTLGRVFDVLGNAIDGKGAVTRATLLGSTRGGTALPSHPKAPPPD